MCVSDENFGQYHARDFKSWFTKIRPQAKIDNFAFKNSNIINEGLFWKRKD